MPFKGYVVRPDVAFLEDGQLQAQLLRGAGHVAVVLLETLHDEVALVGRASLLQCGGFAGSGAR